MECFEHFHDYLERVKGVDRGLARSPRHGACQDIARRLEVHLQSGLRTVSARTAPLLSSAHTAQNKQGIPGQAAAAGHINLEFYDGLQAVPWAPGAAASAAPT